MHRLLAFATLLLLVCVPVFAEAEKPGAAEKKEKSLAIRPEEARKHVGKLCVVTMTVKASKDAEHREVIYLDSEEDFQDAKNLGVRISYELLAEFRKQQIESPADHYRGKTIRVTGKVILKEDRPYIEIEKAGRIEIVKPKAARPETDARS